MRTKEEPKHPKYDEMVKTALVALKDRTGSSVPSIAKYLGANYTLPDNYKKTLSTQLKNMLAAGKLVKVKASYKLSEGFKKPAAKTKAPKKKTVTKKVTPKKAAPKKKVAPKKVAPKRAATKKTAPKKTAAKKTAPKKVVAKKVAPKKASAPKKVTSKKTTSKQ